jgi:Cu(I)/Ag(I) efflux system membrane protein CusA/SilA
LQKQDRILRSFPEVQSVLARLAAPKLPPISPLSMIETVVVLKPKSKWRGDDD